MKKNAEDIITSSKNIPKSSSRKRPRHELRTDDVNNLVNTETGQVHIRSMRQECALNEKDEYELKRYIEKKKAIFILFQTVTFQKKCKGQTIRTSRNSCSKFTIITYTIYVF